MASTLIFFSFFTLKPHFSLCIPLTNKHYDNDTHSSERQSRWFPSSMMDVRDSNTFPLNKWLLNPLNGCEDHSFRVFSIFSLFYGMNKIWRRLCIFRVATWLNNSPLCLQCEWLALTWRLDLELESWACEIQYSFNTKDLPYQVIKVLLITWTCLGNEHISKIWLIKVNFDQLNQWEWKNNWNILNELMV